MQVVVEKRCNACHGVAERKSPDAEPVMEWHSLRAAGLGKLPRIQEYR